MPLTSPQDVDIPVANLLLDSINPRFSSTPDSQQETIRAMLRVEGPKTLALARHIAEHGLSPGEQFLVVLSPDDPKRYIVLDGNRRTTALRILHEPKIVDGAIPAKDMKALLVASGEYHRRRADKLIPCVAFESREAARKWIELRHGGEMDGAGIVKWGALEKQRFASKATPSLQVLDLVEKHGHLDQATRAKLHEVPITNLKRLLDDPEVRGRLGIDVVDGHVVRNYPLSEVVKGLTRVVSDVLSTGFRVKRIYGADDRRTYIAGFGKTDLPNPKKRLPETAPLEASPGGDVQYKSSGINQRMARHRARARTSLIQSTFVCEIGTPKIANICTELRRLSLDRFPNATSVLLRVFLELSIDHVIETERLMPKKEEFRGASLRTKMAKVAVHLENKGALDDKQAKNIRKIAQDPHIVAGVDTLHEYVHNGRFAATTQDLATIWDNLEPLFAAIWGRKAK